MLDVVLKFKKAFQRLEDEDTYFSIELSNDTPSAKDGKNATAFAKFLKKNFWGHQKDVGFTMCDI